MFFTRFCEGMGEHDWRTVYIIPNSCGMEVERCGVCGEIRLDSWLHHWLEFWEDGVI